MCCPKSSWFSRSWHSWPRARTKTAIRWQEVKRNVCSLATMSQSLDPTGSE
jgi:uncharacterized protein YjiS (DUF1127 family)